MTTANNHQIISLGFSRLHELKTLLRSSTLPTRSQYVTSDQVITVEAFFPDLVQEKQARGKSSA
jgi:hypothetical protein